MAVKTSPRHMTKDYLWQQAKLTLRQREEFSRSANGQISSKSLGSPYWFGEYMTAPMHQNKLEELEANIQSLNGISRTLYAHTAKRPLPGGLTSTSDNYVGSYITHIASSNEEVRFANLPANATLLAGDYFTITTASGIELHRLVSPVTADAAGATPYVQITPPLRPSVAVNDAAIFDHPYMEAVVNPGSFKTQQVSGFLHAAQLELIQVVK